MPSQFGDLSAADLFLFLRIGALLEARESLNSVAKNLHMSSSTVSLLLDRVQNVFSDRPLFERRVGAGGGTELTEEGRELLAKVLECFRNLRGESPKLIIASSQFLITNQILSPVLAGFLSAPEGSDVQLGLHLETKLLFDALQSMIRNRKIDVAFVWGTSQRVKKAAVGVELRALSDTPFDLVFVCHDPSVAETLNKLLNALPPLAARTAILDANEAKNRELAALKDYLRGYRIVTLAEDGQPHRSILPHAGLDAERDVVQVDTYDAAIAVVRARVGDIALVPAIYPTLSRLSQMGEIYFTNAAGLIPILVCYPQGIAVRPSTERIVERLAQHLRTFPRKPPASFEVGALASRDLENYRRIRYGYYIDLDRETLMKSPGRRSFSWGWETFDWDSASPATANVLHGRTTNHLGHTFELRAERHAAAFVLSATRIPEGVPQNDGSVPNFISTFTLAMENPFRIFGTWTSSDPENAGVYATILCETRLELKDLVMLQEATKYSSILSSDAGPTFAKQPKNHGSKTRRKRKAGG